MADHPSTVSVPPPSKRPKHAAAAAPATEEGRVSSQGEQYHANILEQCGFFKPNDEGGRNDEALAWQVDVVMRTGGPDKPMSRAAFCADMTQRGYDPGWSLATFRGTDIDNSGAINLHVRD